MTYKVEQVNDCTKKLSFSFENLDLTEQITVALKEKQKSVSIKGFRKGKAPIAMVEKLYRPQVEGDALNRFVQKELFEAINKEDLKVVGYPNFENMDYKDGKSVSFDAVVEIFPTVELKDYSKLSFTKDAVEVTEEDVEKVRKNYLAPRAEMVEAAEGTALANGLFAVMNFEGEKADGEKPENMKGEEYLLEIGSGQFIPGFEDQMVGMKAGEKKTLEVTFPSEYHVEELKEANVKFHVELLEIKERKLPDFTDEVAKELGFESVEDFKVKTKENLTKQNERQAAEKLNQEILEKLISENSFDVPTTMVAQQKEHLKNDLANNLKQQGFTEDMLGEYFEKWAGDLDEKALFQVKSGLILDHLASKFEVESTDADFDAKIEESASLSGLTADQVKEFYTRDERMKANLMYAIREEKTFAKLHSELKIK
ncbi:trigger factor [Halobacteriovorax sp. XZX-3]|uniref:trigger factor n=1 Tax=unclassified Halobacteriovorax TaxID=2639665 RepID=UPI000CD2F04B|nr:trigger factor [Halobacteriovorax sp. DA5]POB13740.1 trigger factor [Halobacteriovorax sp. DA5]